MRIWQTIRATAFERHSHDAAYAALVLSGSYEEAGDYGRFRVQAGDAILHDRFEGHVDRFPESGAVILNFVLPEGCTFFPGAANIAEPDLIARTAEKNPAEAAEILLLMGHVRRAGENDWPDELANALIEDPSIPLSAWAHSHGMQAWTLSRGFKQVFGISAEVFRARSRTRQAWKAIQSSADPLAQIAYRLGFADQAHMSRSMKQFTGFTPQAWRSAANGFKTHRKRVI